MSNTSKFFSSQYLGTPQYELKRLLIALREINGIPLSEMAKEIGVTPSVLLDYERSTKPVEYYEAMYIEALKEYVYLASQEKITFEEALKIYMNQRGLYKYNISYKMALFGSIMYESLYINMNSLQEKGAVLELPRMEKHDEHHVWNEEKYNMALYLLAVLREMLDIDIKTAASYLDISKENLREFETLKKNYKNTFETQRIIKRYSNFLEAELAARKIKVNVYSIICRLADSEHTKNVDGLKLRQMLLNEIYN